MDRFSFALMSEEKTAMRQLVRLVDVDIPGNRQLLTGMRKLKGVSHSMARAVCLVKNLDPSRKIGMVSDAELDSIEEVLRNPQKFGIPNFMVNRRRDFETGEDMHIIASDITLTRDNDIKRMRMIRSLKGFRHGKHLPVRGQRTKAHFRHGKSLGVAKKKGNKGGRV